jgi:hypothetical protein
MDNPQIRMASESERNLMTQSFTFIDVAGNQAQYTIYDKDLHDGFYWSTEHGDQGLAPSVEEAQSRARVVLKDSMAANRRSGEVAQMAKYTMRWR